MEASLSVQWREGSKKILSRDGGGGTTARGQSASWARPAAWYRRALGGGIHLRRQPAAVEAPPAAAGARERTPPRGRPPLWRSSLKAVGSALARACKLVCSGGVHSDALAPTMTKSKGRDTRSGGRSPPVATPAVSMLAGEWGSWRCVFMGTSSALNDDDDDVLVVRWLVLEEEYATRRRVEMQAAARRSGRCWFPPGPSRLSQMSLADDDDASEV